MSLLRRGRLPAWLLCLPALAVTALAARAADDAPPPLDAKAVDAAVFKTLREVINEGADMYNAQGKYANMERNYAGCYYFYQGALTATRPLLASRPELQKAIDDGLQNAANTPEVTKRAFVLREVIDKVRDAVKPDKPVVTPSVVEKTTKGTVAKADALRLTVKGDDGKESVFAVSDDATVIIDGKAGRVDDIKKDSTVTVTSKGDVVSKVDAKSPAAPPPPKETTVAGKVTKSADGKITVKPETGDSRNFTVADEVVTIDGKPGKAADIKADSTVTVTLDKDGKITAVAVKAPAAPPPPKVSTVLGKVVGVEKDKLTVSVDEKDKVFTVPAAAKVMIDEKEAKLEDLKKDSNVLITSKDDAVVAIEAKSPTPPPPPKEKTTKGTVTKNDKGKLTVKDDAGKETTVVVPLNAKVTIDGKNGQAEDIKADSAVTITSDKDGAITQVDAKAPGAPPPPPAQTLWDRLGGEANVAKVVDDFVNTAGKDPKVNFFRDPTFEPSKEQVAALKKKLVEFVSAATGGPLNYTGKDMKEAHKGMKITDAEFDALAADLKAALEKNGAKADDVKSVLTAVEGTRKAIVEVKAPEDKDKPKPPEDKPKPPDDKPAGTGSVSGKVAYKGQPLAGGAVVFTPADGKETSAPIAADGTYSLEGVKAGEYTVAVDPTKPPPAAAVIPKKFTDPKTSGLKVTIRKDKNVFDIQLED